MDASEKKQDGAQQWIVICVHETKHLTIKKKSNQRKTFNFCAI